MKRILLPIFFFLVAAACHAQIVLSGRVTDAGRRGLDGVNVCLFQTDTAFVAGVMTDAVGAYRLRRVQPGNYLLLCSAVGYKTCYQQVEVDQTRELPLIVLEADTVALPEVVVNARSYVQLKDYLLVFPSREQKKHAYTGYDLLYNLMIPGLEVNRAGEEASTSRGGVSFYINGVSANTQEVHHLRPAEVERVEYHALPRGHFWGDRASVNYITKRYKSGGYVSLEGKQALGYREGDWRGGMKLSHGKNDYMLFAGDTHTERDGTRAEKDETFSFPTGALERHKETLRAELEENKQYLQLKANHNAKRQKLSGTFSLVHTGTPQNEGTEEAGYATLEPRRVETHWAVTQKSLKPAVTLRGDFQLTEKQFLRLLLDGSYSRNSYERTYQEGGLQTESDARENFYSFYLKGMYSVMAGEHDTFGAMLYHAHGITESTYGGTYSSWQHLWKGESQLFASYDHTFGKRLTLSVSPGVSLLNYKLHTQGLERYWTFRTGSYLSYQMSSSQQLSAGVVLGNEYPDISYLNTATQEVDFLQQKQGKASLDNTKIYTLWGNYSASFRRLQVQCELQCARFRHNVCADYFVREETLVQSFRSDGDFQTLDGSVSASYRASSFLQAKVNIGCQQMKSSGCYPQTETHFVASADVSGYWKDFSFNGFVRTSQTSLDKATLVTSRVPSSYGMSIAWHSQRLMAEIGTASPFTSHRVFRSRADFGVYRFSQSSISKVHQKTGYLKVSYTIDFGKKTKREKSDVDMQINSAILKAN